MQIFARTFIVALAILALGFGMPAFALNAPIPPSTPPNPNTGSPSPGVPQAPQTPGNPNGGAATPGGGTSGGVGAGAGGQTLGAIVGRGIVLVQIAIPIMMALATLGFFFGAARFIFSAGNEDARRQGKQLLLWGVIVLFILVCVWGIVFLIQNTFGLR